MWGKTLIDEIAYEYGRQTKSGKAYVIFMMTSILTIFGMLFAWMLMLGSGQKNVDQLYAATSSSLDARYEARIVLNREGLYVNGERRTDCSDLDSANNVPVIKCAEEELKQNADWKPVPLNYEFDGFFGWVLKHAD